MAWWTENYQWILAGFGALLLVVFRKWAIRRLFNGVRGKLKPRQDADIVSLQIRASQAENATVTRPRGGAIGAVLLKLALGGLTGVLVIVGALYAIALLQGAPVTALPGSIVLAVTGSVAALWILIGGVYLLGRLTMRRRAKQIGVRVGIGVSCYEQSLVLSIDPTEALAQGRAAILSLPGGAELDRDHDAPDELVGRTVESARSFGEIIRIRVQRLTPRRAAIEIQSWPATWQLFDGGVNAENVAGIVRYLEARATRGEKREPVADEAPAREKTLLTTSDWLALLYLAALAGYTGLMITLKELWPDAFAAWASAAVPLDALRLLGLACPAGDPAAGYPIIPQLNILIPPTLLAYTAYNTLEFRHKRDRMDALNWILCLGSLFCLPLLVLMGCSAGWGEGLPSKYRGLIRFMLEESTGGAVYALMLVIFTNGVSYLPAMVLARIFGTNSK